MSTTKVFSGIGGDKKTYSKVLKPPGGGSSISFGATEETNVSPQKAAAAEKRNKSDIFADEEGNDECAATDLMSSSSGDAAMMMMMNPEPEPNMNVLTNSPSLSSPDVRHSLAHRNPPPYAPPPPPQPSGRSILTSKQIQDKYYQSHIFHDTLYQAPTEKLDYLTKPSTVATTAVTTPAPITKHPTEHVPMTAKQIMARNQASNIFYGLEFNKTTTVPRSPARQLVLEKAAKSTIFEPERVTGDADIMGKGDQPGLPRGNSLNGKQVNNASNHSSTASASNRKIRPGDDSSSNIFGAATEEKRQVKNYQKSSVFEDDAPVHRQVKDYQKSDIFGNDNSGQRPSSRGVGDPSLKGVADGIRRIDVNQNGSPTDSKDHGSAAAKARINPITGAVIEPDDGGSETNGIIPTDSLRTRSFPPQPTRNPIMADADDDRFQRKERASSPLSVNRQRNREGTHNPITGASYGEGGGVGGADRPQSGGGKRVMKPPGGDSTSLW